MDLSPSGLSETEAWSHCTRSGAYLLGVQPVPAPLVVLRDGKIKVQRAGAEGVSNYHRRRGPKGCFFTSRRSRTYRWGSFPEGSSFGGRKGAAAFGRLTGISRSLRAPSAPISVGVPGFGWGMAAATSRTGWTSKKT